MSGAESIYDAFLDAWLNNIEKPEYLALDKVQDGVVEQIQAWHRQGITILLVTMRGNRNTLTRQCGNWRYVVCFPGCRRSLFVIVRTAAKAGRCGGRKSRGVFPLLANLWFAGERLSGVLFPRFVIG